MSLLFVLMLIASWAWAQRYALMEDLVKDALVESGFDAELNIKSVTRDRAQISDIYLRRDGEDVLRIKTLTAEYIWPDVRSGQLERLELDGAQGRLDLGEDWRPKEDWVKELLSDGKSEDGESEAGFPIDGIGLSNSQLTLISPLGNQTFQMNADMTSPESFRAEIILPMSDISYGAYSAKGSGTLIIAPDGEDLKVQGQADTETLSNSKQMIEDASLTWDGTMNIERQSFDGAITLSGHDISGDIFEAETAQIKWAGIADLDARSYDGELSLESVDISSELFAADSVQLTWDGLVSNTDEPSARGFWSIATQKARTPRQERAAEIADTLSLFPALSVVPVTEYYAPELKQIVEAFFLGADVTGEGDLEYSALGFTVTPRTAMRVKSSENNLQLIPREGRTFFGFDATQKTILAQLDAKFDQPANLMLTNIDLRAKSENGVSLGRVERFEANLETGADWTAIDEEKHLVRLGPLQTSLKYRGGINPRHLAINTGLDYDGPLPGGRVEALILNGRLDVRLYEGRQELDFTPKDDSRITLKSMETPTAWLGEDINFNLSPTENLFTRTKEESYLSAILETADFTLTQPATASQLAQRLDIESAALKLLGRLTPDRTQDWTVEFEDVLYASDTLPAAGTTASAAQANLTAKLTPNAAPQITIESPSVTGETPLARLSNFEISLAGTPDRYSVEHSGGSVDVIGSEFADLAEAAGVARFPANGRMEFVDGRFVGEADLVVAKADNADVSVAYEFANGAGTADIDVPSILFTPKGLQPQTLVPAFRGKIAQVEGEARAKINIAFADGALTESRGTVELMDMAVGTAPGPISGLNTTLQFNSLWPLETNGRQTMSLKSFNPGLPLEDGVMTYDLVPGGVQVYAADWPIGNGFFSLDPFTWRYGAEENRVTMRVKNVALGDFLNGFGNKKLQATGNVVGEFPIVVRGIEVLIEKGVISVPDGGVITYEPGPSVPSYSEEEAIAVLREQRREEYALLAQDALREFRYKELSASIDGPLEGDVEIGLVFDGSNAKVLNRQPFRFDISVRGELFNIARSFNSNAQVKSEILRQNGQLPEGTIIGE